MSNEWHQSLFLVLLYINLIIKLSLVAAKKESQIEFRELGSHCGTHLFNEVIDPEESKGNMGSCYQAKEHGDCCIRHCDYR